MFASILVATLTLAAQPCRMWYDASASGETSLKARTTETSLKAGTTFLEVAVPPRPAGPRASRDERSRLYAMSCAACHGVSGKGDGFWAWHHGLLPPPRDFTKGEYKFRTTVSGSLPTDSDIYRTIARGIGGTAMPSWQRYFAPEELWALVDHVKAYSRRFAVTGGRTAALLPPVPSRAGDVRRGRALFEKMQCAKCHGAEGLGDGPAVAELRNSDGRPARPRNFTDAAAFRAGWAVHEIRRTLETGLNGTPMPSFAGAMTPAEERHLATYVMSLSRGPALQPASAGPRLMHPMHGGCWMR
jgi:mono/diheme cytochrome c family protein